MIVDMHASVVPSKDDPAVEALTRQPHTQFDPRTCTVEATLDRMDASGVDQSVVWCLGYTLDECRRYNDFIAEVASEHPDRFIPFATVFPTGNDASLEELHRSIRDLGMAGLKLHPDVFRVCIADPAFLDLVTELSRMDWPFVTHVNPTLMTDLPQTDVPTEPNAVQEEHDPIATTPRPEYSAPQHLDALVRAWDSPRVQAAHMGGVTQVVAAHSSLTFQTAGASPAVIRWAVNQIGVERLVFGSDYPFFAVDDEVEKVRQLGLSSEDEDAVLGGNAVARVLRQPQD